MYEYIKKAYGVNPVVGRRVQVRGTTRYGVVARIPKSGANHYVWVKVPEVKRLLAYHPLDLDYFKPDQGRHNSNRNPEDVFELRPEALSGFGAGSPVLEAEADRREAEKR